MKCIRVIFIAFFLPFIHSIPVHSQEIFVDTTIQISGELFPFGEIEVITGLRFSGDIVLNHDTSLVRLVYTDFDGHEFILYETYPLIADVLDFSVSEVCDETCFLEESRPYSLEVQLIDAKVTLKYLHYDVQPTENPPAMQYAAKRAMDAEKIEMMNDRIGDYEMHWTAGDNDLVDKFYFQKQQLFGEGYNLLGYEYYQEGVFEYLYHSPYPKANPDLVWKFDWRERHSANISTSPYWDGDS